MPIKSSKKKAATPAKKPITAAPVPVRPKKQRRFQLLRGFKDNLPQEQPFWKAVTDKVEQLANDYSYQYIQTPIIEPTGLFKRTIGDGTDVVQKEMFEFKDRGGDSVSLRPEGTASVVRAYIQHGMIELPQPVRLWYMGPMFRYERPQAGRYRQHYQIGFESIGDNHSVIDAQQIMICTNLFQHFGVPIIIQVNSIGHKVCRGEYIKKLVAYYKTKRTKLCDDCKVRLKINPLRVLDCKHKDCQEFKTEAPQIVDHLCEECREHFVKVLEYLDEAEVPYQLNPHLVRGFDYYTKTVFEIWTQHEEEEQKGQVALGGGGRYDDLVELLGDRPTPAAGFALGMERMLLALRDAGYMPPPVYTPQVFVAQLGDQARQEAIKLFRELRQRNYRVAETFSKDGLKGQLEQAARLKVAYTLVIGQKEMLEGTVIIRDMESGIQEIIDRQKIITELAKKLNPTLEEEEK
jgi:histidyl-tRNA synthetase